jgi:hypothetical protein
MWLLTIHHLTGTSSVLQLVGISEITHAQPTMYPTLKTCTAMAAGAFFTCINLKIESPLPQVSSIVVSTTAYQYSTKDPFLFWSLILNSWSSSLGLCPLCMADHLPGHFFTDTKLFHRSPLRQLWLPVHRHIRDMNLPS